MDELLARFHILVLEGEALNLACNLLCVGDVALNSLIDGESQTGEVVVAVVVAAAPEATVEALSDQYFCPEYD